MGEPYTTLHSLYFELLIENLGLVLSTSSMPTGGCGSSRVPCRRKEVVGI